MNHLRRARNPACAAIYSRYVAQQENFPGILESDQEDMDQSSNEDNEFPGDFFGARYTDNDFPGFDEEEEMPVEDAEPEGDAEPEEDVPDPYWSSDDESDDEDSGEDGEDLRSTSNAFNICEY